MLMIKIFGKRFCVLPFFFVKMTGTWTFVLASEYVQQKSRSRLECFISSVPFWTDGSVQVMRDTENN